MYCVTILHVLIDLLIINCFVAEVVGVSRPVVPATPLDRSAIYFF